MEKLRHWFNWAEAHPKVWLDLVRIYLGVGLFVRGVLMFTSSRSDQITDMLQRSGQPWLLSVALLHYVAVAHFVGGILLIAGLLTRLAAGVQVPILAGAVFLIHRHEGLLSAGQSLEFSALVLVLLTVILAAGPGPLSVDGENKMELSANSNHPPASA
ncbi:MAG: DoxX family protein [Candidatus Didemnitutus sp.]|nr:DoxX family protein [Candidatus Didemnitutus sp.]